MTVTSSNMTRLSITNIKRVIIPTQNAGAKKNLLVSICWKLFMYVLMNFKLRIIINSHLCPPVHIIATKPSYSRRNEMVSPQMAMVYTMMIPHLFLNVRRNDLSVRRSLMLVNSFVKLVIRIRKR